MKRLNRKTMKIVAAILVVVMMATVVSLAMFTDRESAKMQFTTATFRADGYTLKREAPVGPFIAGEDVSVSLWETNTKDEDVNSVITMNVSWNSPDPNSKIFGNSNSADNATITLSGNGLDSSVSINYTVNKDGTITFDLPKHLLAQQSSDAERQLTFHIPESLVATGSLDFTFIKVELSQVPSGFTAEYSAEDLNAETKLNFDVDVGWAASANAANNGKTLMAYLTSDGKGIEFKHAFGSTSSAMKDFPSASDALWSQYNDSITKLTFIEGMSTIGDYGFTRFSKVTSVTLPDSVTNIGTSAFASTGLTGELTIPKSVTNIESLAFGKLPNVTTITFKHGASDSLTLPSNSNNNGAFYVGSPYTATAPLNTKVNTNLSGVLDYNWTNDHRGYTVTVETLEHGNMTANPIVAINGKTITMSPSADTGYAYGGSAVSYTESGSDKSVTLDAGTLNFTMPASNVTVTPKWNVVTYDITYDPNGGTMPDDVDTDYTIEETPEMPVPTRPGYEFDGWVDKDNPDSDPITELPKGGTGDKEYIAEWTAISYKVKYNANTGSGTMADSTHTYDVAKKLTKNTFTKTGYKFIGWAESASGAVKYTDEQSVKNLTTTKDATVNLYAKWEVVTYNITYDPNGGTMPDDVDTDYTIEETPEMPEPTRPGYEFDGWVDKDDPDSDPITELPEKGIGDKEYIAEWTAITYKVKYNANGGSGTMSESSHTYDKAANLSKNAFTKTGYTFEGWATSASGSVVYTDGQSVKNLTTTNGATVNLYAKWTANDYSVKYNANGGSGTMSNSGYIYDKEQALTKNTFTKEGYTFAGWATSADGSMVYTDGQSVKNLTATDGGTVNLYAKWTANTYKVKYNANGGSGSMSDSSHTYDKAANLTKNAFTRTGYTFAGWATSASGSVVYTDQASVKNLTSTNGGTVNLYAKWTANTNTAYTVKHWTQNLGAATTQNSTNYTLYATENKTGTTAAQVTPAVKTITGFTAPSTQTVTISGDGSTVVNYYYTRNSYTFTLGSGTGVTTTGSSATGKYQYGATITLKASANTGYTWSKWTSSNTSLVANNTTANTTFTMPAGNVTMTPSATANDYTIKYNANGGSGNMSDSSHTYDAAKNLTKNVFTKTGYTFAGWATSADGAVVYADQASVKNLSSTDGATVNLYAKWSANTYSVKYNANGGSGSMSNSSHTYDASKNLTKNTFTKTGYTFAGWATSADGVVVYADQASVKNLSSTDGATVNLYAKWTANTYSVKYNANGGSGTMSNSSHTYDATKNLTKNAFTKTGYTFAGWATSADGTVVYADQASVKNLSSTNGGTVNLYAKWTANTNTAYTVKHWTQNLGAATTQNSTNYTLYATENKTGTTAAQVTPAVKTITGFTAPSTQTVTISGDGSTVVNYYYTRNSYTFTLGSGTGVTTTGSSATGSYQYGATITLKASANTGYTWSKWTSSNTNLVGNKTSANTTFTMPAGNITMTPSATANTYAVKYNANGGSGTMSDSSHTYNASKALTANAFTRTGYTFAGWATSADGAVVYADQASVKNLSSTNGATVNLYAKWTANTYSVKYNANGGSGTMSNSSHTYDTAKALTKNSFTKTGYTFAGWATSASGDVVYTDQASIKNLSSTNGGTVNLYAKWTANTYSVKYNANGGSGSMSNSSHTYDTAKNLTKNAFTKTGYTFAGWATSASGDVVYTDQASVKNLSSSNGATVNLYAKWTANTYSVKYNANGGSGTMSNSSHTYDVAKNLTTNAFTKTGYTFAGWATSASGTVVYGNGQSVKNLTPTNGATVNLYAKWNIAIPVLAKKDTWYSQGNHGIAEYKITSMKIQKDPYTPASGAISWDASDGKVGTVYAHLEDDGSGEGTYKLTIAGNGYAYIQANVDSTSAFKAFQYATTFTGIEYLNTSKTEIMKEMFGYLSALTELDVSSLDTSSATDMWGMFGQCWGLTELDLSNFDTSNVTNMCAMFQSCSGLTSLNVSSFDTSKVTDMYNMFSGCKKMTTFNITNFNTSNVEDMAGMFQTCYKLQTVDLTSFNTSKVNSMARMFNDCDSLTTVKVNLTKWDTGNVTNMDNMFFECDVLETMDISKWDMSSVTTNEQMFARCDSLKSLTIPSTLTIIDKGFAYYCYNLTDITFLHSANTVISFPTPGPAASSAYSDGGAFYVPYAYVGTTITTTNQSVMNYDWTTDNRGFTITVADATGGTLSVDQSVAINEKAISLTAIADDGYSYEGAALSYEESGNAKTVALDPETTTFTMPAADVTITPEWEYTGPVLPILDERNTWYEGSIAKSNITKITFVDMLDPSTVSAISETWDASSEDNGSVTGYLLSDNTVIVAGNGYGKIYANPYSNSAFEGFISLTSIDYLNIVDTSMVVNMSKMFYGCNALSTLNVNTWDTSNVKYMSYMFDSCSALISLNLSNWNTANVTEMSYMFNGCSALTSLNLSNWDTSKVTTMAHMFDGCSSMTAFNISHFNTVNVKYMQYMFYNCTSLVTPNVNTWDISNATDMSYMFFNCSSLASLDLSNWNTAKVTSMSHMFYSCSSLTSLTLSNWNTANVTTTTYMFAYCKALTSLDISHFDTANVKSMQFMFMYCENLSSLNVTTWDTSNATNMSNMFNNCSALTALNPSNWNTANVTNMSYMFNNCSALTSLDLNNWDTTKVTNMSYMFYNCKALSTLNVNTWNTSNVTNMASLFRSCSSLTSLNLSNWNTAKVTNMSYMFAMAAKLNTIYASNEFSTSAVTSSSSMFSGCYKLVGGAGTAFSNSNTGKTYARIDSGPDSDTPGYFTQTSTKVDTTASESISETEEQTTDNEDISEIQSSEEFSEGAEETTIIEPTPTPSPEVIESTKPSEEVSIDEANSLSSVVEETTTEEDQSSVVAE